MSVEEQDSMWSRWKEERYMHSEHILLAPLGLGSKAILSLPRHCWSWLLTFYYTPETGSENTEHIVALQLKCPL